MAGLDLFSTVVDRNRPSLHRGHGRRRAMISATVTGTNAGGNVSADSNAIGPVVPAAS
jgi:hypothetical protein